MLSSTRAPVGGRLIAGRYRLLEAIGSGGMAQVWRAHDEHLDRDVAIKVLNSGGQTPGDDVSSAEDEARLAARLVHPNIVRVYDVGADDGLQFVVMELVSGESLSQMRGKGPIEPARWAEIAAQLADALEHAHRTGVVHCDVKPQNVIVTDDGVPKLLDFGIAQRAASSASAAADEFIGSLPYVAPEQARGEALDGRADVYALGAVLYELLTGQLPFNGATPEESLRQRLDSAPPSPRALDPAIPETLETVVLTALATDPADRYQTAGDLRDALRASMPVAVTPDAVTQRYAVAAIGAHGEAGATRMAPAARRRGRRRALAAVVVAGVLLAGVAGLLSAASSRQAPAAAESSRVAAEPTPVLATSESTATPMPAVAPPANPPSSNPAPAQPKPAPAMKVQQNDDKEDKKDEKKSGNQGRGNRGRD